MAEAAASDSDESYDTDGIKSPVDEFFDAIWSNDLQKVEEMLNNGFSPMSVSSYDNMALHYAVLNNRMEVFRLFKEKMLDGQIDAIYVSSLDDTICGTPLHTASDEQVPVEVFKQLLQWGANPNAENAKGEPVLHHLIAMGWQDFEAGFENEYSSEKDTTSNKDKGYSYLEKMKLLHEYGAEMNIINKVNGLTALHCWCRSFYWCTEDCLENPEPLKWGLTFIKTFLECGANPDVIGERNTLALVYFAQRRYLICHTGFINIYKDMSKLILSYCKNLNSCDIHGRTLLHIASEFSNCIFLEELLIFNIDVNKGDRFGLAPLHLITHNKNYDELGLVLAIINTLVRNGSDVNIRDNHGSTPCHHAVHMANVETLKCLIDHGASLSVKDNKSRSVRDLGILEGTGEIKELLDILYDRTDIPIVKGVTDLRFGWFYPQCCHLDYKGDKSHGTVDAPTVYHKEIEQWLSMYPMCIHNANVILQNSIPNLETNQEQEGVCREDTDELRQSLLSTLNNVAVSIGKINNLYQCSLVFGGSVSEGTKVGSPDEYDIVFNLERFAELVFIEENADKNGHVCLKIKDRETLEKFGLKNIEDGYLKRTEISKTFHALFEECLREKDVWNHTKFFCDWGTTNAFGEGMNIGQMKLVWYGPTLKRQDVSVDIVPVIKIPGWQPRSLRKDARIINKDVIDNYGCYLVMKSTEEKEFPLFSMNEEDIDPIEKGNQETSDDINDKLFRISHSHLEHAIMSRLPQNIKNGYKIAKSIQLQCPSLTFDISLFGVDFDFEKVPFDVGQCITSYILKSALFHLLHDANIRSDVSLNDLEPDIWNTSLENQNTVPNHKDIKEALVWTSSIYKKVLDFCEQDVNIPTYFITCSEIKTTKSAKIATKAFCEIILRILKNFPVQIQIPSK